MELHFKKPQEPIIALIYQQYDKILTWNRILGKVDYPPKISVIPKFAVKQSLDEESVNY